MPVCLDPPLSVLYLAGDSLLPSFSVPCQTISRDCCRHRPSWTLSSQRQSLFRWGLYTYLMMMIKEIH
jgi:hypothetical protein